MNPKRIGLELYTERLVLRELDSTDASDAAFVLQLVNDPGLLLCTVVNSVDPTGALCDLIQATAPRTATGTGARTVAPQVADPTLGGLVEVTR